MRELLDVMLENKADVILADNIIEEDEKFDEVRK